MPSSILSNKFNLKQYDIDNFRRKPKIRNLLEPWRISLNQSPSRLFTIFKEAWHYYLTEISQINFDADKKDWAPRLISLKKISHKSSGFSFLTNSKYLEIICPDTLNEYRSHGFTNIALGVFQFWPGRSFLTDNGILPFMFYQTHKSVLDRISVEDMIEHVYLNFLITGENQELEFAKEIFYARYDERSFITSKKLTQYGVPDNFYNDRGGLRLVLSRIAEKFAVELGHIDEKHLSWSATEFRNKYPNIHFDRCKYCGLSPVDLHHLLPRSDFPTLIYHSENVIPLCLQIHGLITRNNWNHEQRTMYEAAIAKWKTAPEGKKVRVFDGIMKDLHKFIYGYVK